MREPGFWRQDGGVAVLLAPLAACYGAIAGRRMGQPGSDAGIPVICVGNLTVGGAGKTPTAIAVAKVVTEAGGRPFILTRGYGGSLAGPVRVDPTLHGPADVGDEPLLLARAAPTIVSRDRVSGARAARAAGASLIVMDDGFQNPSLRKNISLIVVDGPRGVDNGKVFPAGPLRAPLAAQLAKADAILVSGSSSGAQAVLAAAPGLPVFHGRLEPDAQALAALRPLKALAFAGIRDPDKFFTTLVEGGIEVRQRRAFPDHHRYGAAEAAGLVEEARRQGLTLVTTEKDMARLTGQQDTAALAAAAKVLPVTLRVGEADAFRRFVLGAIAV